MELQADLASDLDKSSQKTVTGEQACNSDSSSAMGALYNLLHIKYSRMVQFFKVIPLTILAVSVLAETTQQVLQQQVSPASPRPQVIAI